MQIEYEIIAHKRIGKGVGLDDTKIGALENGADSDAYDDLEKDVLRFTDEIVKSDSVSEELFRRLQEKLSPGALVELNLAVGFYIMTSKFLVTFGVDLQKWNPAMPEYEHILVDHEDGVAIVTLNRPEVLNAMNNKLSAELHDAIVQTDANDDVGCIVITGSGEKAFTAGGDIHEQRENDVKFSQEELDAKRDVYMSGAYEISASKKPTIGMMNGLAYGGGAVLASSLDMQIGCEKRSSISGCRLRSH